MELIQQEIFSYLKQQQSPVGIKRLMKVLKLPASERSFLRSVLQDMARQGQVIRQPDGTYGFVGSRNNASHPGFPARDFRTVPVSGGRGGLYARNSRRGKKQPLRVPSGMGGRFVEGDRVAVATDPDGTAWITGVEQRSRSRVWGRLHRNMVTPAGGRRRRIRLHGGKGSGEVVEIVTGRNPQLLYRFKGSVADASDICIYRHNLFARWPDQPPADVPQEEYRHRHDLQDLVTFTIDGPDAKDFDDALSLEPVPGGWELGVHIADVSAHVPQGHELDRQAFLRGVSVYMPGRTLPMLPDLLSSDRCSLKPEEPRLAVSVRFQLDKQLNVRHGVIETSIIRSQFRLRYDHVNNWFDGESENEPWEQSLGSRLKLLERLANHRRRLRRERGSIFLSITKPLLTLTEGGHLSRVAGEESGIAEQIVEECMLLANEYVGQQLASRGIPAIYRIHPDPGEELRDRLNRIADEHGLKPPGDRPADFINQLTDPQLHYLVLRLMGRARYSVSPEHHFGLGTSRYLHFTSPIRRYPDLVVHRIVKSWLRRTPKPYATGTLDAIADQSSFRETGAFHAELDLSDMLILDRIREMGLKRFSGRVSGLTEHGVFVELEGWFVDGMIPLGRLQDHYSLSASGLTLEGRHGNTIHMGQILEVERVQLDPELRSMELKPVDRRL